MTSIQISPSFRHVSPLEPIPSERGFQGRHFETCFMGIRAQVAAQHGIDFLHCRRLSPRSGTLSGIIRKELFIPDLCYIYPRAPRTGSLEMASTPFYHAPKRRSTASKILHFDPFRIRSGLSALSDFGFTWERHQAMENCTADILTYRTAKLVEFWRALACKAIPHLWIRSGMSG